MLETHLNGSKHLKKMKQLGQEDVSTGTIEGCGHFTIKWLTVIFDRLSQVRLVFPNVIWFRARQIWERSFIRQFFDLEDCQLFAFINRCRAVVLKVPLLKRRRNGLRRSISNSLLKQRTKLQSPRISIAKRRLEFLANMVNRNEEKGTDLARWLLKAELDPKEHGFTNGGKVSTHYLKNVQADLMTITGVSDPRLVSLFFGWCWDSDAFGCQLVDLRQNIGDLPGKVAINTFSLLFGKF